MKEKIQTITDSKIVDILITTRMIKFIAYTDKQFLLKISDDEYVPVSRRMAVRMLAIIERNYFII